MRCTAPQKKKKHEILALPQGWWMVKSCHIKSLWRLVWDVHQETHKAFWPIGGGFNWDHGMRPSRKNSEVGADSGITKCPLFAQGSPPMAALQGIFSSLKKTAILPIERGGSPKSINPAKMHIIPSIQNKTKATLRLVQSTNLPWFFDDVFAFCFLCPGSQPPFKKSGASFWKMINPY